MKIAVIGTGRMGSIHTRNLLRSVPEADLVAVCDIRLEVAQSVADELGIQRVVQDYHELLADKDIEAVLIATSTDTHAEIVIDAARAGKHIFCEKPLALDLKDIDDVLEVVELAGVKLQVGFNRRFDKSFRRVREFVQSGQIGRPCMLRITDRDPEPPSVEYARSSGGMFLDQTIHDFDMARFQIGEIEEIYAIGNVLVKPDLAEAGDVDTDIVTLKFTNGAIGVIDNSRQAVYGYDQRLEVFGSDGSAEANNEAQNTVVVGKKGYYQSAPPPYFFIQRYAPCYVDEVREFLECVRDDKIPSITGEDGRMAVVLGFAAWKSLRENRPVKISEFLAVRA
ncbi:MAG: inositol 2-dehydrogenase [Chloroflexi bacterium]|nr:MAG: inositol 2-dehydrogenase [Chloroflexota bacterium]